MEFSSASESKSGFNGRARVRQPFWLTKYALFMFFIIFAICAESLILLNHFIISQDGLSLSLSSNAYSWTYGPTAILVVILGLWRRIDYHYKAAQPWLELQAGPSPAERSLFLDYVSPFQLLSMFQACRLGHHAVAGTIFSFFLLKGIILVSTTLFVVRPSFQVETLDIDYQTAFDATNAWASPPYNLHFSQVDLDSQIFDHGSDSSIWQYLARLSNQTVNDTSWNTQDGLVTQRLGIFASTSNVTSLKAPVDVFVPKVDCQSANFSINNELGDVIYGWSSDNCVAKKRIRGQCPQYGDRGANASACGVDSRAYLFYRLNCSAGVPENPLARPGDTSWPDAMDNYDIRYAITAARYKIKANTSDNGPVELFEHASAICKIDYSIVSANVSYDLLTGRVTFPELESALDAGGKLLSNMSRDSLAEIIVTNLDTASRAFKVDKRMPFIQTKSIGWYPGETLFQLLLAKLGYPADLDVLLQPVLLKDTTTTVLEGLLMEFAQQSLLVSKNAKGTANGVISQLKLYVRPVALWVMVGAFSTLAIVCLLLLLVVSKKFWIPAMCGSIAGHAAIFASSGTLKTLLGDSGSQDATNLRQRLGDMQFMTRYSNAYHCGFAIEAEEIASTTSEASTVKSATKRPAWVPIAGRLYFVVLTLLITVLAIGTLELLGQLSKQRQGLLDLSRSDSTALSNIIRLASTALAFIIATMFNSLDFTIETFTPYSALRSGSIEANRSIMFNPLSVSPFLVLYKTLRRRQFGAAASNLSSVIGSLLTIVVSGLWVLTGPTRVEKTSDARVINWDKSWVYDAVDDGGAAMALNIVRHGGSNTSTGIWDNLVLPEITLGLSGAVIDDHEITGRLNGYTYSLGGVSPMLNCTVISKENFKSNEYRTIGSMNPDYRNEISVQVPVAPECIDQPANKGSTELSFGFKVYQERPVWFGLFEDLKTVSGEVDEACPSIGIFLGQVKGNNTATWNATALACSQQIEQVPVTVTYKGNPALKEIDEQQPPELAPGKSWTWHDETNSTQTFGYKLKTFLNDGLMPFEEPESLERSRHFFDVFFNHLLFGPNGVPKEDLVGLENTDNLIRVVTRDYSEYMKNVIDLNFRSKNNSTGNNLVSALGESSSFNITPASTSSDLTGTSSEAVTRLGIDSTSKFILQALLAVMVIFGWLSYCLVKIDGTIPCNPCSIASTMAILSGSQMCDRQSGVIPRGAEFMSDGELKSAFDGRLFSLGWWDIEDPTLEGSEDQDASDDGTLASSTVLPAQKIRRRFGVDVGQADVSKY